MDIKSSFINFAVGDRGKRRQRTLEAVRTVFEREGSSLLRSAILALAIVATSLPAAFGQSAPANDSFDSLLHRGFELHQKNEYSAALPFFQTAWKLRPHDYFVNLLSGIDLLRTGKAQESIRYLREAARQKPKEEFAYEYLGEAYATLQKHAEAFTYFKKSVDAVPDSAEAGTSFVGYCLARFAELSTQMRSSQAGLAAEYRLQALSRKTGDPTRLDLLQRATALSNDEENWIQLAITRIAVDDLQGGTAALQRARQLAPDSLGVAEVEAFLDAKSGDWTTTDKFLTLIVSRSPAVLVRMLQYWPNTLRPEDKSLMSPVAEAFLDCVSTRCNPQTFTGRLPIPLDARMVTAEKLFGQQRWESIARLPPPANDSGKAWFARGIAWAELDQCEKAVPALERALIAKQDAPRAMFSLSRCYAQQADETAAQLARSGRNDAVVHLMRGDVLLRLQANSAAAVQEYQAAVTARPEDPAGWERLAEAQLAAESTDAARQSAQQALKLDAHRQLAPRTLAQAAMQERNYQDAVPLLRQLAKQNPNDLTVRVQLATAESQTGELQEALANLDSALKQDYPDEKGSLHYQLGTVLRRLGRAAEAERAFAKAKELSDRFQNSSLRSSPPKQED